MKKAFTILAIITAVVVVGAGLSNQVDPQPADVSRLIPTSQIPPSKTDPKKTPIIKESQIDINTTQPKTGSPLIKPITDTNEQSQTTTTTQQQVDTTQETFVHQQQPQPSFFANLFGRRRERYWCQDNGNGTVTYGTANWVCERRVLFCVNGYWDYGIGLTMPGSAATCDMYLEGVPTIVAP